MTGIWRVLLGGVVVLLINGAGADAFHGRSGGWSSSSFYYYVPNVSYYCPAPLVVPMTIVPVPGNIYAIPTPAPASQTIEPPLHKAPLNKPPMPPAKASDDHKRPLLMAAFSQEPSSNAELCRVVFWNLSGRDRTLTIDGKATVLPKDRSITLEVKRRFAWQFEERSQRIERVPDGQAAHDIVIRD